MSDVYYNLDLFNILNFNNLLDRCGRQYLNNHHFLLL